MLFDVPLPFKCFFWKPDSDVPPPSVGWMQMAITGSILAPMPPPSLISSFCGWCCCMSAARAGRASLQRSLFFNTRKRLNLCYAARRKGRNGKWFWPRQEGFIIPRALGLFTTFSLRTYVAHIHVHPVRTLPSFPPSSSYVLCCM